MEAGQARARQANWTGLGLLLVLASGCASGGAKVDHALARVPLPVPAVTAGKFYQVHCPDELRIEVSGPEPWQGQCTVGPDGRIPLAGDAVRIEGMTPPEIAAQVADHLAVRPDQVRVQITGYKSQQVYVFGEVAGLQRAVPYQGPETVVELLHRVGGVTPGASPGDVQVVRSHVAEGRPPEVFTIDLTAILLKNQQEGNIRIQPFDQVYVGQSKRCCLAKNLPPWLRPLFEQACGMKDSLLPPGSSPMLASLSRP